jgi:RHS repeat-associated protein
VANPVLGQAWQTAGGATTAFTRTPRDMVSMRTATGSVYYLTDNQGSVIGLVNNQGQKVAGYSYTPYGQTRTITGTPTGDLTQANTNPYRYTSGYLDPTSNLYKLGYRYYDPNQGRFTQQDPSGQEPNHYLYAEGNPANNIDPTGLFCLVHNDQGGCLGAGVYQNITNDAAPATLTGLAGGCAGGFAAGLILASGPGSVAGAAIAGTAGLAGGTAKGIYDSLPK